MGVRLMSILLINVVGLATCSAVAIIGVKSVYHTSQIVQEEEDYLVEIPLNERNVTADVVGLGVEVVGYGMDVAGDISERLFDSRLFTWLRDLFSRFAIKADGKYFKFKDGHEDNFEGWYDEPIKIKPGKFEMEM